MGDDRPSERQSWWRMVGQRTWAPCLVLSLGAGASGCAGASEPPASSTAGVPTAPPVVIAPVDAAAPQATQPDATATEPTRFSIAAPKTVVWAVLGDRCIRLTFVPREPHEGRLLVAGRSINYEARGEVIELSNLYWPEGHGLAMRRCQTKLHVADDGRLGGADLFAEESACLAARDSAAAFDDSVDVTRHKCDGRQLEIDTAEVRCGHEGRHAILPNPGCFSLLREMLAAERGAAAP